MDQYNVLSFTPDLDELERDMDNWNMLTYDEKKAANDYCLQRYNMTNENLYNYIKASILNSEVIKSPIPQDTDYEISVKKNLEGRDNNITLSEGVMIDELENWRYNSTLGYLSEGEITVDDTTPPIGYNKSGKINPNFDKIEKAVDAVKDDNGDIVIINDFLDDFHMDYTLDDLQKFYDKYNNLSYDHKMESDVVSVSIWGRDVPTMYAYMKAKIENMIDPIEKPMDIEISPVDKELNNFKLDLLQNQRDHDIVANLRKLAQVKSNKANRTNYENAVLEGFFDKIRVNGKTYLQGMPEVTPFLTYDEYVNNPISLDEKKINFVDPFTYVLNFKDKEHKIKEELEEAYNNHDTKALLSLGWNPIIEPSPVNLKYARERQAKWLNEYCGIDIYNLSNFSTELDPVELSEFVTEANDVGVIDLAPIYLVVAQGMIDRTTNANGRGITYFNEKWSVPGIAFDPKLNNIYYYSAVDDVSPNTMEKENLKRYSTYVRGATIAIIVFFVPKAVREKIKSSVEHYYTYQSGSNRAFKNYDAITFDNPNLFSDHVDFVCGQFLNSIFKISDISLNQIYTNTTEKVSTTPSTNRAHMIMLFKGKAINYSESKIRNKTNALLAFNDYMTLTFFKKGLNLEKNTNNLRINLLEDAYITTNDSEVNKILIEMRSIFKAYNFMDSANVCMSLEDYRNRVNNIEVELSECGYADLPKIEHLINEIYNIKNELASKTNIDASDVIESATNIYNKYVSIIKEGGRI